MTALGGYREVGRSATLLSTRESKVLIDCGMDVVRFGAKPYFNAPEIQPLDQHRRHRHHPRPPGPLRPSAGTVQVRLRWAGVLHRPHPGPDVPAAAGLHQGRQPARTRRAPYESAARPRGGQALHPPQVRRDHRHRAGHPPHVPERRAYPRLRRLPLPHRRRPLQHRLHRRHEVRADLAVQRHHQQVPPAGDAGHRVHLRRLP